MNRLTPEQRFQIVQIYFENHGSVRNTYHALRPFYVHVEEIIAAVERSVEEDPNQSIRHRAQESDMCPSTL
ncbi:unnamed protein product [Euphydryas editha]|uniref:DUF4817 domain-containing protein n=1 Tax=Euphydryas editha TaxID=104508 RepID=A0AAU9UVJ0_EUPED|nr:unnamed protein product [Euphydryas editha]